MKDKQRFEDFVKKFNSSDIVIPALYNGRSELVTQTYDFLKDMTDSKDTLNNIKNTPTHPFLAWAYINRVPDSILDGYNYHLFIAKDAKIKKINPDFYSGKTYEIESTPENTIGLEGMIKTGDKISALDMKPREMTVREKDMRDSHIPIYDTVAYLNADRINEFFESFRDLHS